jgi:ribosomal protein L21
MIEKIDAPLQSRILLDKILLVGTRFVKHRVLSFASFLVSHSYWPSNRTFSAVGQPLLTNVKVHAEVEEQTKSAKVIIFKAKRRKGYKKHRGHRQPYTLIRILDVMVKEH